MLIIGAKGHAKEVLHVFTQNNQTQNLYFFDDISKDNFTKLFDKFEILRSIEEVEKLFISSKDTNFALGIGNPIIRYKLVQKIQKIGGNLTSIISSSSLIGHYDVFMERGADIMPFAIVTNSVSIKEGTLINRMVNIGHDTEIGKYCEFSPSVTISGNCKIGDFCSFGTGAIVLPKIKIGNNVIVGAGAVVTKDVEDNCLVVGIPAKVIKKLEQLNLEI